MAQFRLMMSKDKHEAETLRDVLQGELSRGELVECREEGGDYVVLLNCDADKFADYQEFAVGAKRMYRHLRKHWA